MSHQICSCEPVCYINSYTLFIHECLLLIPINILIFMHFANGPSVCLLWKPFLWMAGGLIDLHYHILLLNLEGHMHKNRWWPINLQPPCRSGAVPARRISKFMLLKTLFFPLSLWLGVVVGFRRSVSRIIWPPDTQLLKVSYLSAEGELAAPVPLQKCCLY